jgi:hypothetical protein
VEMLPATNSGVTQTNHSSSSFGAMMTTTETPTRQEVKIGLSNDTYTEILSGLQDGERVVINTISGSSSSSQTQSSTRSSTSSTTRNGAFIPRGAF